MSNSPKEKKAKAPEFTSPKGIASYPKLLVPDTKFDKAGVLSVKLVLTEAETDAIRHQAADVMLPFMQAGLEEAEAALAKAPKNPKLKKAFEELQAAIKAKTFNMSIEDQLDESGAPTGNKLVAFKQKAHVSFTKNGKDDSFDVVIPMFDAKGKQIITHDKNQKLLPNAISIWSGSELKVRYQIIPAFIASTSAYHATLRPVAVQVIKLVSGGGSSRDAAGCGFGEEEGGFEAPETPTFENAGGTGDTEATDASGY